MYMHAKLSDSVQESLCLLLTLSAYTRVMVVILSVYACMCQSVIIITLNTA